MGSRLQGIDGSAMSYNWLITYFQRYPDSILRIENDIGRILISLSCSQHKGEMEALLAVYSISEGCRRAVAS